ncbi:MAG: hypothetical protein QOE68_2737 [Thermoanaerobaculia bacterium]|jgi:hypothetical protein|nr:hypothetical protein [Thermoanaerobaculia bacterium]
MRFPLAALALVSVLAEHPPGRIVTIVLPHAPRAGETATLVVTVGKIQRGAEIEITTTSGRFLGVISPYGIRAGREAGTYTVPLPAKAIARRRVSLILTIHANGKQRAPTMAEITRVRVRIRSIRPN